MTKSFLFGFIFLLLFATTLTAVTTGTPANITSPTPGTKLTSASATFNWTTGTNVTSYSLYVGTTRGAHDIAFISAGTSLSATVMNLPTNGGTFYVSLNSLIGGAWQSVSYTYVAAGTGNAAAITSPANGAKLSSGTQLFQWSGGVGISQYSLYIGTTRGAHDIAFINAGTASSYNVTGLPTNGSTFYVTLYSLNGKTWLTNSYSYIAAGAGTAATINSPANGSKLASSTQLFQWSGGVGISQYSLYIGTARGGHDIAFINAGTASSYNVTGLPTNGSTFYVTLYCLNGKTWLMNSYTYVSSGSGTAAHITSPTPGSQLNSTSATFSWAGGVGIAQYSLYVGTTVGAHDIAFVNAGLNTSASVSGLPTAGQTIYVTLNSLNGSTWLSNKYTYVAMGTPLSFMTSANDIPNGLINYAYSEYFSVTGGTPPYTFTLGSGSLPAGLSFSSTNAGLLTGTPTTAGAFTFAVKVTDSAKNTLTSPSFKTVISSAPNGAHNSYVTGQYVCSYSAYVDSDDSRVATLMSLALDGAGHVTSGVYDSNGRTAGLLHGTATGSYNLGSDNNGTFTVTLGSKTLKFAMMGNNVGSTSVTQFNFAEIDDVGASASGRHGGGWCAKATTTAFANSTLDGKSFAFLVQGENDGGKPRAMAGRLTLTASGSTHTISNGQGDQAKGETTLEAILFNGSYTEPDSTGRFTLSINQTSPTSGSASMVGFVVDANQMLILDASSGEGAQSGEMRKQQQASYSAANLNGNFVISMLDWELDVSGNAQRWMSTLLQGTGAGGSGSTTSATINQSFLNEADSSGSYYTVGDANGTAPVTLSSNGRGVVSGGGAAVVFYAYDNNAGLEVGGGYNPASSMYLVEFGHIDPQTATTPGYATYVGSNVPRIETDGGLDTSLATLASNGTLSVLNNGSYEGGMDYASTFNGTFTVSSYGAFFISQNGEQAVSCFVISTSRAVCMDDASRNPSITTILK